MPQATYFHAGCPVCVAAEDTLVDTFATASLTVDKVHLGQNPDRVADARDAGVESVPALVIDGEVFHINFGAALEDLAA